MVMMMMMMMMQTRTHNVLAIESAVQVQVWL